MAQGDAGKEGKCEPRWVRAWSGLHFLEEEMPANCRVVRVGGEETAECLVLARLVFALVVIANVVASIVEESVKLPKKFIRLLNLALLCSIFTAGWRLHAHYKSVPLVGRQILQPVCLLGRVRLFKLHLSRVSVSIRRRQIEEVRLVIDNVKGMRVDGVDPIARVDIPKGGNTGPDVGDIRRTVRLIVRIRRIRVRRHVFVEDFKLIIVRVPKKLALDDVRKAIDDSIVVSTPHLNAVIRTRRDVADDLYLRMALKVSC